MWEAIVGSLLSAALKQSMPQYGQTSPNMGPAQQGQQGMDLSKLLQQGQQQPDNLPKLQLQNRLPQPAY